MAMIVQHNMQAMNANRMLGVTTGQQSKSTEKLSTGYKINRAADDAAGLTISEKMRKQVRGLDRASENAQDGISCVQTAEGALTEVHSMLQRMNELAVQAANGTMSENDRGAVQDEIDQLVTEIDRVSETTKFNEIYLLKGEPGTETTKVSATFSLTDAAKAAMKGMIKAKAGQSAYGKGEADKVTGDTAATTDAPAKMTYADKGSGTNHLYGTAAGDWSDTAEITADNLGTYFTVADDGTITAKGSAKFGVATASGGASGATKTAAELVTAGWITGTPKTTAGAAQKGTVGDYVEIGDDGALKYKEGKMLYKEAADTSGQYGAQLTEIAEADLGTYFEIDSKALCSDAAATTAVKEEDLKNYFEPTGVYKGGLYMKDNAGTAKEVAAEQIENYVNVNVTQSTTASPLEFNLHVGSESDDNNKIKVSIASMSSAGIGVDVLKGNGLKTEEGATDAIDTIADAISAVSKQRSTLGAVQNRLEHTISNLDNVVENTQAAESRIRDTDMAEEMVEYSKNNILAQAGQSMLAQANQATQGVLSLLQ